MVVLPRDLTERLGAPGLRGWWLVRLLQNHSQGLHAPQPPVRPTCLIRAETRDRGVVIFLFGAISSRHRAPWLVRLPFHH